VKEIHACDMYHGDIKLENLLLSEDFTLKLSDFGFANTVACTCDNMCGTKGYFAPELFRNGPVNRHAQDIFACCVVLFIFATGSLPFKSATTEDTYYNLLQTGQYEAYWNALATDNTRVDYTGVGPALRDLFQHTFADRAEERPGIDALINHEWM
jgi:serine/threonine protein kinase